MSATVRTTAGLRAGGRRRNNAESRTTWRWVGAVYPTSPLASLEIRKPPRVSTGASLADGARAMREGGLSSVLVGEDPPAVISEWDLARVVDAEADLKHQPWSHGGASR